MVKTVCWRSPVPFNPTTRPYPRTGFSRTPSMVAMSPTAAVCTVSSASPGSTRKEKIIPAITFRKPFHLDLRTISEPDHAQDGAHNNVWRTIALADHAFSLQLQFEIGNCI